MPEHLCGAGGLPRSKEERLLWIRQRVEQGYYDSERIKKQLPKPSWILPAIDVLVIE